MKDRFSLNVSAAAPAILKARGVATVSSGLS
jgi:hypothetical protein